ncbi:MAG: hypothetical protein LBO67_07020 [Spirochaetaceae bacterium]|jgi:hypothetical protein|nr:hypothetical protein [Spirochaetaceae bacterium]
MTIKPINDIKRYGSHWEGFAPSASKGERLCFGSAALSDFSMAYNITMEVIEDHHEEGDQDKRIW